jgi:hypothetical protein
MPSAGGTIGGCRLSISCQTALTLPIISAVNSLLQRILDGSESEYYEVEFLGGKNSCYER